MKALLTFFFCLSLLLNKAIVKGQSIDPIKFTLETKATQLQLGEEMEMVITAQLLDFPSNTVFVFKENYSFKIKMIFPEGFVTTGGSYRDYIGATLSPSKPVATYSVKGKFVSVSKANKFSLLRGSQDATDQSQFIYSASLSYTTREPEASSEDARKSSETMVLDTPEFVPFMTKESLRAGLAGDADVVKILYNDRVYTYRYDSLSIALDNSVTVLVRDSTRRYLIDTDYLTPEMFGAKGDGITDDSAAIQACLDVPGYDYLFRKNAIYAVGGQLLIKNSNTKIIGANATIKARSDFSLPAERFIMRTGNTTPIYSNTSVSINIYDGSAEFTMANASTLLRVGDMVRIEGPGSYPKGELTNPLYSSGHLSQIKRIVGDVVTMTDAAIEPFTGTKIYTYKTLDAIEISDLNFDHGTFGTPGTSQVFGSLSLSYCTNAKVTGGKYRGNGLGQIGLIIDSNINTFVQQLDVDGYSNLVGSSPIGYGISMTGHNVTLFKNRVSECKHSLATSDRRFMSTGLIMDSNICYGLKTLGNTAPLDYHANARGKAINNTVYSFNTLGAQFRDGGIDVIDNTIIINYQGTESLTFKGLIFYEKYFGENRIEGNKIFVHHATAPLGVQIIQVDVDANLGSKNRNVSIRKNYLSGGNIYWEESDGGLVIEENELTSPGDMGTALISPGIQIINSQDFLIRNNTFTNNHVTLASYAVIVDIDSKRGTIQDNKINLVKDATSSQIRLYGDELKVTGNTIMSGAATGNSYIGWYTSDKKILLLNNKKILSPAGPYVNIGYGSLQDANAFYSDHSVMVIASNGTTRYTCKSISGVYTWVLDETLIASDAEKQISASVSEDSKVVSRSKLFNWWAWLKTQAQVVSAAWTFSNSVKMSNLPTFASESAAAAGGLTTGSLYKTSSGEIRIKL
ncbi:right-handed parallel beta-helix repeat-containing protein [Dyadobacter endophyticus]|uniref:right-handed parallel beta-helix repeat-containing protein n=1 Tax=Dyadobacter endophyticus TaxID=1749036 RepID=UPI003CEA269E